MSDGETIEEAITKGIDAMRARGPPDPRPDPLRGYDLRGQLVAPGRVLVSSFKRSADSAACVCS
jgi:hypothetical protein